jgi:hypothetical protein
MAEQTGKLQGILRARLCHCSVVLAWRVSSWTLSLKRIQFVLNDFAEATIALIKRLRLRERTPAYIAACFLAPAYWYQGGVCQSMILRYAWSNDWLHPRDVVYATFLQGTLSATCCLQVAALARVKSMYDTLTPLCQEAELSIQPLTWQVGSQVGERLSVESAIPGDLLGQVGRCHD